MKFIVKMILAILAVKLLIFLYFALPWIGIYWSIKSEPDPSKPEITYGEFPFKLEYEINGERKIVEDTLICEFDGFGMNEGVGKYRKWKEHLASGNKEIVLLLINDSAMIYYGVGGANYYMDDMEEWVEYSHEFPDASLLETDGRFTSDKIIYADELLEKYNIKLISWEYTKPITNTFK